VPAPEQAADDLGVDHRPAPGGRVQSGGELADVGHPVFQQVADSPAAVGLEQPGGEVRLDVLAEDHHRPVGVVDAQLEGGAQALVAEARRHPDVGDDQLGAMLLDRGDQAGRVPDRRAHGEPEPGQQLGQTGP
jgi:hypothetical protein